MSSTDILKHERKVLDEVLKAYGDWASQLIIGGGYAPIIYRLYFSPETSPVPIMTMDLDTLVRTENDRKRPQVLPADMDSLVEHRVPNERGRPNLFQLLTSHGFKWNPKNLSGTPPESYKKEIDGQETEVEFITYKQPRNRDALEIKVSGVVAQALSYLEMSFEKPLKFKSDGGTQGLVVSPGAWVFHKGLTFNRRRSDSVKYYKDLYGIWFVLSQLGSFSKKTKDDLKERLTERPAWAKTLEQSLKQFVEDASPEEWRSLELQDPSGELSREDFVVIVELISELNR